LSPLKVLKLTDKGICLSDLVVRKVSMELLFDIKKGVGLKIVEEVFKMQILYLRRKLDY
jgi:hypothetical protein